MEARHPRSYEYITTHIHVAKMDVVLGIKNIQRNLEPESQWNRVIKNLRQMTNLEVAQAWVALASSINTQSGDVQAILMHSQYRVIFDRALKEVFQTYIEIEDSTSPINNQILDEYKEFLLASQLLIKKKGYNIPSLTNKDNSSTQSTTTNTRPSSAQSDLSSSTLSEENILEINGSPQDRTDIQKTGPPLTNADIQNLDSKSIDQNSSLKTILQYTKRISEDTNKLESAKDLILKTATEMDETIGKVNSLSTEIQKINVKISSLESAIFSLHETIKKYFHNQESKETAPKSGIDETPTRPVATSTEMIDMREKLDLIESDIQSMQARYTTLEQACLTKLATSINKDGKLGKSPLHVKYSPFTGTRRKTRNDSAGSEDILNSEFISKIFYIKELEARLKKETADHIAKTL